MELESTDLNPYVAPTSRPDLPTYMDGGFSVHVSSRSPIHRTLIVSGPVPGVIEYSASGIGYEVVRINRVHVKRVMNPTLFGPTLTPRIDFEIPTVRGPASACLEVRSFLFVFIGALRLTIGTQVVYSEGHWKVPADLKTPSPIHRTGRLTKLGAS